MSAPVGRREFFALEAGEYLERIGLLTAAATQPDPDDFVRYTRALRGAALMGGPPGYATAAAAIEGVAKALKDGARRWDPGMATTLGEVVEECKVLLRRLREWSDLDLQRCESLADRLDGLAGGPSGRSPLPTSPADLSAGVRAFVAREAAGVAASLDQVAEAVSRRPAPDSAAPLLHRLQPLRGMGALPGLSPLPELLEALDLAIAVGSRGGAWPPATGRAFKATGAAFATMARDIAEVGVPQTDAHEIVRATELLREAFARDDDVVPILALAGDGDLDGIVLRGFIPAPPSVPVEVGVELTGLADRLRHAAEPSRPDAGRATQSLSLFALALALRGLPMSPALRAATGPFFLWLDREAMAGRSASEILGRAAQVLAEAAKRGSVDGLAAALTPLAEGLDRRGVLRPEAAVASPAESEIIPIEALAPDPGAESDVVPIESLLLPSYLPFEQTFSTWFALGQSGDAPAPPRSTAPAPAPTPVPIQSLLYRGRRALERADQVRRELDAALRIRRDFAGIETLLAELLDLVPLALDDSH